MSLIRRPPPRPPQTPMARAWWLAGVADPAWLAVALTVAARALGARDPARALISTLAVSWGGGGMQGSDVAGKPESTAAKASNEATGTATTDAAGRRGAGADDDIDLMGGTGRTGTSTAGLVDAGMTTGPTTTGTSASADAAASPYLDQPLIPSVGAQGGAGEGRSASVGNGGLDESAATDDPETPALATDEAGGD
jgi:hypothetical protein